MNKLIVGGFVVVLVICASIAVYTNLKRVHDQDAARQVAPTTSTP